MVGCKLSCSAKDARKTANKGKGRYKCWTAHGLVLMQNERDGDVANHISMQAHVIFLISFHDETTYVFLSHVGSDDQDTCDRRHSSDSDYVNIAWPYSDSHCQNISLSQHVNIQHVTLTY